MAKKYKLTDETTKIDGKTLYRIEAIIPFVNIHEGDLGGFIESEKNLSHEGNCWVYDESTVSGNAIIKDDASVCDDSWVKDDATVEGKALIRNAAIVGGKAVVKDKAWVDGGSVYGEAVIEGDCQVRGDVSGHAKIKDDVVVEQGAEVIDAEVSGVTTVVKGCEINGDIKVNFTGRLKPIEITPEEFGPEYLGESALVKFKNTAKLLKEAVGLTESVKQKEIALESSIVDDIKHGKNPFSENDRTNVQKLKDIFDDYDVLSDSVALIIDYEENAQNEHKIVKCDMKFTDKRGFEEVIEYADAKDALSWLALNSFDFA
jgi:carbonic anhydrase/acetyltransferase-like protein (isoleucine patch superfamily)